MKKVLNINFSDFWGDFKKEDNLFTKLLEAHYDLQISDNPDVLIYSCYGFDHLRYKCHKIFYTAENVRPDHLECDFSISFDFDENKNLRLPLFRWSPSLEKLYNKRSPEEILSGKSKFCCMVVSNGNGQERNEFFAKLSKYKKVDSGGRFLNNIGYNVPDKVLFAKDYKFIIAFENSCYPGYTTEKIFQPMLVDCLPVYWGNPEIQRDFNPKSFINVHDYGSFDEAINEIIRIDQNDDAYFQYLREPYYTGNKMPQTLELDFLSNSIYKIIESFAKTKPVAGKYYNRIYQSVNKQKKRMLSRLLRKQHWYC